ncbi:exodeoxyribonuclease I [Thioalkalicoccus limnaeus]|uniref:Exodeoxyribonuclease I n=1 Tax=Thioalkalicoccus limnaeus TaxID=120681 RepID=A0ABV4BCI2_9GAMM
MAPSFYWHDYETWGSDPRWDRPAQFAGQRTDLELNPVGAPLVVYCRPGDDRLPDPTACLITGITPWRAARDGIIEARFADAIHQELARPGTCGVGYNSLRFDDEVTRHLFYRNLIDPYGREWRHQNSRWDLIDALRLAHALRPDGVAWPTDDEGVCSFRLEALTAANGIEHGDAHEALADVRATIALAARLKRCQPRLFDYALSLRDKRRVQRMLAMGRPLLHVSARYPAALGCLAPVLPIAPHPTNGNGTLVYDLRWDPAEFLDLSLDEISARLFTPAIERPEGAVRVPVKTVHSNRCPMLAPMTTLTPEAAVRWAIDLEQVASHARALQGSSAAGFRQRVAEAFGTKAAVTERDPERMLYSGGFFSDADRRELDRLRGLPPLELARESPRFEDPRLPEMLLRYRARNWPETLTDDERADWDAYRFACLTDPPPGGLAFDQYRQRLLELRELHAEDPSRCALLDELDQWAEHIMDAGDQ